MDNEKEFPKRKPTRLKNFDYSSKGAYFVTICVRDRMKILSEIVRTDLTVTDKTISISVGEGLAPPEFTVRLKPCGEIVKEQLHLLETRFSSVTIEDYVIMPDHIHAIIFLHGKAGGASPSPTLDDVVCAFKSLTSRSCKQKYGIEKCFSARLLSISYVTEMTMKHAENTSAKTPCVGTTANDIRRIAGKKSNENGGDYEFERSTKGDISKQGGQGI